MDRKRIDFYIYRLSTNAWGNYIEQYIVYKYEIDSIFDPIFDSTSLFSKSDSLFQLFGNFLVLYCTNLTSHPTPMRRNFMAALCALPHKAVNILYHFMGYRDNNLHHTHANPGF